MMKAVLVVLLAAIGLAAASITVSGFSSGGAFAVQYHVANSANISGAGIVAGIPYYCAQGEVGIAETSCMKYPSLISVNELIAATKLAYTLDSIDEPTNLANSKVFLYSGNVDTVVVPGVVAKLLQYYLGFIPSANVQTEFNISSEHAMVTNSFGNNCSELSTPYINNCHYDAAGVILNYLYGKLKTAVTPVESNIVTVAQEQFIPENNPLASLGPNAYLYVPTGCPKGTGCPVHVVFHGCEQSIKDINTTFVTESGYNGWAEANNIVVVYPQATESLMNPDGCWDWWGYTGFNYATKKSVQSQFVNNLVNYVSTTY